MTSLFTHRFKYLPSTFLLPSYFTANTITAIALHAANNEKNMCENSLRLKVKVKIIHDFRNFDLQPKFK